jgi:hypothetical protein
MATPYQDVFSVFVRKITDYSFTGLTQSEFEDIIIGLLDSSCTKFEEYCKVDLTQRDNTTKTFAVDLSNKDKEILGTMMIREWLSPLVYTTEIASQVFSERDFKIYSQANHLSTLMDLVSKIEDDINSLITKYTWNIKGLEDLR